jgi:transglycosylase-like protein
VTSRRLASAFAVALLGVLLFALAVETARGHDARQLVRGFYCIKKHEALSWSSNTGNGYFGGLQMDMTFQRTYGREYLAAFGTADRWPPFIQIAVAIKAHLSGRGFGPWPNARRACGL